MHKITGNGVSAISSHSYSNIRILLCYPVDKSCMQFIPYSIVYMFLIMEHIHMLISLYLPQSKYTKIHWHEISFIGLNVLEFFCVQLYTEFLSDLHEKFQVASVYDTNVEYQIWCFCCNLFPSYADKRHTDTICKMKTLAKFLEPEELLLYSI